VVICLELGADFHMAQLMPLPLTVSCFSKIHIGFDFLVPAHLSSPGKRAVKRVCVCAFSFVDNIVFTQQDIVLVEIVSLLRSTYAYDVIISVMGTHSYC